MDAEVRQHLEETLTDDVTYSVGFTAPPRKGLDVFLTNLGKDNKVFSGWSMTPLSTAVCSDSCLAFMLVDESFEM